MSNRWRYWSPAGLLLAGAALGQPTDKPVFRMAEPERTRADDQVLQVVVIDYPLINARADRPSKDDYALANDARTGRFAKALPNLLAYVRTVPGLDLSCQWRIQSLNTPLAAGQKKPSLLYMTGNDATLALSDEEKTNLGDLLLKGILLYAEEIRYSDPNYGLEGKDAGVAGTPFDRQFKELMRDPLVLGSQGGYWEKIPRTHPLYSCYFGFPDGPPQGGAVGGNVHDLEMLQLRGRPVVIFSDLNISWYWGDPLVQDQVRERGLQFGANLLIFAKTQGAGR